MQTNSQSKPKRPFGVSLAILTGVTVFAILPLLITVLFIYLNNRVYLEGDGSFSGLTFLGLSTPSVGTYTAAAILFLGVAFFAWRGRPAAMRFIFPLAVFIMAILMSVLVGVAGSSTGFQAGIDSAETARQVFREGYVIVILLVVVYISWFFNRWSARAYYRGYYTPEDLALITAYQQDLTV